MLTWMVWPLLTISQLAFFQSSAIAGISASTAPVMSSGDCCEPAEQAALSAPSELQWSGPCSPS
jgi:hypothetical protein